MNERFIVSSGGLYGHWGAGATLEEAKKNMKKAGGDLRKKLNVNRFTSKLPFAPANRKATEEEADCWIGRDGSLSYIRCERETVQQGL